MKKCISAALLLVALSGCGSNSSAPEIESVLLEKGSVVAGTTNQVSVSFRVEADKVDGAYLSRPFSVLVNLPSGATAVPGSSKIFFKGARAPNVSGSCPDGRTFLMFDFDTGEFPDTYDFDTYVAVMGFDAILDISANQAEVFAVSSLTPLGDGCASPTGDTAKFVVTTS